MADNVTTTSYGNASTIASTVLATTQPTTSVNTTIQETTLNSTAGTTTIYFSSTTQGRNETNSNESACLRVLYEDIGASRVRIWDVALFLPNLLFLMFLLYRFYKSRGRLHRSLGGSSPIFTTYFCLVIMTAILSVIRCIVSMTVDVSSVAGSDANKLLWVTLRFFLLMAEMSVLVFGLACGHLDSKSSIRRVLLITTFLALIYSTAQGVLEMMYPDPHYIVQEESWTVYGHGGALFSFITSVIFFLVYTLVDLLPLCDCVKNFLTIPTKKTFYVYVSFMALLYFCFALGSGLLYNGHSAGLCILDATSLIYFILFAPFLYVTFLHSYLGSIKQNSVLFSYSAQVDEGLEDIPDNAVHGGRPGSDFNGVLVFDRIPASNYSNEKNGMEEPLHDLAGEKLRHDSEVGDSSTVNFFKDIDLGDNDDELNFR
ncbi:transmembrane protein adipocyte-associated 1 homolog [Styela clava]